VRWEMGEEGRLKREGEDWVPKSLQPSVDPPEELRREK